MIHLQRIVLDLLKKLDRPQVAVASSIAQDKGRRLAQGLPPARMPAINNDRQKELSYGY